MKEDKLKIHEKYFCAAACFFLLVIDYFFESGMWLLTLTFGSAAVIYFVCAILGHAKYLQKKTLLISELKPILKDRDEALQWISSPMLGLNGKTPWEFSRTQEGFGEMKNIIRSLKYGN